MNWLEDLKVGDEVVVSGSFLSYEISRVTHTTATQIHIGGTKYRRDTGVQMGSVSSWNRSSLCEPTQELRDKIEHKKRASSMGIVTWQKLSLDQLRRIAAIVGEGEESK